MSCILCLLEFVTQAFEQYFDTLPFVQVEATKEYISLRKQIFNFTIPKWFGCFGTRCPETDFFIASTSGRFYRKYWF